jgi:hypothetical protein
MNWCEFCQMFDDTVKWRYTPDGEFCLCAECWQDAQSVYQKQRQVP